MGAGFELDDIKSFLINNIQKGGTHFYKIWGNYDCAKTKRKVILERKISLILHLSFYWKSPSKTPLVNRSDELQDS
jgi:hypothetical protein